ncbi:hypothetical protein, partial [uncultured Alteromonas sp.]|uniref:hypothetical protein n=1 Tax=uncultured Alteromonas sp. TaxID=179113 RepID=UPI0030CEF47A
NSFCKTASMLLTVCYDLTNPAFLFVGSATASLAREGLLFNFKPYTYQHLRIARNKKSFL